MRLCYAACEWPPSILLSPEERATRASWAQGRCVPFRVVQRARIIQMAADGVINQDIARTVDIARPTVQRWRERFPARRLAGLEKDAPRPGRLPRITDRPTSSAWLNLVARWCRELKNTRLRRGSVRHVRKLITAIRESLDNHHQNPRVFTWTASVESILTKVAKCKEALDALH